jgi:hypothetical protein
VTAGSLPDVGGRGRDGNVVAVTESEFLQLVSGFGGVDVDVASEATGAPEVAWGDTFFSYDPGDGVPAESLPFATIVTSNYPGFDTYSDLDRPGVFRLNMWVSKATFQRLLGEVGAGVAGDDDFTALDTLLPHPVYGAQSWVSILNPGPRTSEVARTLLAEAYEQAVARHERRASRHTR